LGENHPVSNNLTRWTQYFDFVNTQPNHPHAQTSRRGANQKAQAMAAIWYIIFDNHNYKQKTQCRLWEVETDKLFLTSHGIKERLSTSFSFNSNGSNTGRSQLIDATQALKRSAGVSYPGVIRVVR
jgi:hypothetical protein